ncbi:TIGR03032 family protein [Crocinitomix algicola]|uniref:TIGR03032 family protein n=1 Tax=Crocinitomix algicola TaxID=1740263 RepID=UPI000871DEB0|nr:TIGR03032 family protein [Crocinitomix algicola]
MPTQNLTQPFSCTYSPNVPELLQKLDCSIAISTYQAGKLVFISPVDDEKLVQLPRTFEKPMGIAYDSINQKIGLACKSTVEIFRNSDELAKYYPKAPNRYDALFVPRSTFYSGAIDIHDLRFGKSGTIFGVNTLFSCLVKIDDDYSFTPYWTPPFIDDMVSEDRCHLNGMAMENGLPKYVTMFNQGNKKQSWRTRITETGTLMDITTNKVLNEDLGMPHSPLIVGDKLFLLQSAKGNLVEVDRKTGEITEIVNLKGFVRGMAYYKDYLFIGLSKLRKNSSTFAKLPIADLANHSGIAIVHVPTGAFCGEIKYHTSVDEIFDIEIFPGFKRPNILNKNREESQLGISIPQKTFWAVKQ